PDLRGKISTHWSACPIGPRDPVVARDGRHIIVPPAEQTHFDARAAGAERLAALHRVEQRIARVLRRPYAREPARITVDLVLQSQLRRSVRNADGAHIAFLSHGARYGVMRVGGGDEAQLERIEPHHLVLLQAILKSVA